MSVPPATTTRCMSPSPAPGPYGPTPPASTELLSDRIASRRRVRDAADHFGAPEHPHHLEHARRNRGSGQGYPKGLGELPQANTLGLGLCPACALKGGLAPVHDGGQRYVERGENRSGIVVQQSGALLVERNGPWTDIERGRLRQLHQGARALLQTRHALRKPPQLLGLRGQTQGGKMRCHQ